MTKSRNNITFACAFLLLAGACVASGQWLSSLPLDGYAARVNERVITIGDVQLLVVRENERLYALYSGDELARKRDELFLKGLKRMVEDALIIEEFYTLEGEIPDRLMDDRLDELVKLRFDNDRARFLTALADRQMTLGEWTEELKDQMIVSILSRQEILDKVSISPRDVKNTYEKEQERFVLPSRAHLKMIFISQGETEEEMKRQWNKALDARTRLIQGVESFEEVARAISEDSFAASGGNWGWIDPTELREELASVATAIDVSEISDLIKTPRGYYILVVEERKTGGTRTFDEVQEDIENELRSREIERLRDAWVERLRNKYFVKFFNDIPNPFEALNP